MNRIATWTSCMQCHKAIVPPGRLSCQWEGVPVAIRAPARAGSSRLGDTVAPPPGSASSSALTSLLTARTRAQSWSLRDRPPAGGELVANTAPRPTPAWRTGSARAKPNATLSASRTLTPASAQEVLRAARFGHSVADPKGARPPSRARPMCETSRN
jgi:hypothetical protein